MDIFEIAKNYIAKRKDATYFSYINTPESKDGYFFHIKAEEFFILLLKKINIKKDLYAFMNKMQKG